MSRATLTLKLWDDRRTAGDVSTGEPDILISTLTEGQFHFDGNSDPVVLSSEQARTLAEFLTSNAKVEGS